VYLVSDIVEALSPIDTLGTDKGNHFIHILIEACDLQFQL
jgi:hypothetical protein